MKKIHTNFLQKFLLLFMTIYLLSFQTEAKTNLQINLQSNLTFIPETQSQSPAEDWKLAAEKDSVQIYYKKSDCSGEPVLLLKFVNANNHSVKIEWNEFIQFTGKAEIKIAPVPFLLDLKPGIIQGESCTDIQLLQLVSRPNQMYSIYHIANSKDSEVKSIPNFEIASYRIDNFSVNRK